jgi:toxin ParE1/3/4
VKVVWTETAVAQLAAIHDYIAKTSPVYAQLMVRRIWERTGQLTQFPNSGRAVPEATTEGVRELLEPPYRIIHKVGSERLEILAVLHVRRGPGVLDEPGSGRAT